jgi:competence protein ComEA
MKFIQSVILLFAMITSSVLFAEPVNINTADANSLSAVIKGVGEKRADAIVQYRSAHGDFATVDDLVNVKGIGPATVEKNRANLTTGEKVPGASDMAAEVQ